MTKNQIEYTKVLETRRANTAQEELTRRRDEAAIAARQVELSEASRHNKATEALSATQLAIQQGSLDETARHNRVYEEESKRHNIRSEAIGSAQLQESVRHNKAGEQLQRISLNETARHNLASEVEVNRHNVATEEATIIDLQERQRHNAVTEAEARRHNIATEVTNAGRLTLDTVTSQQQLAETKRHNVAMELKDYGSRTTVNNNTKGMGTFPPSSGDATVDSAPESINDGRFYYDRNKHLMYSISTGADQGWYQVRDPNGRPYIITRTGKKRYVG